MEGPNADAVGRAHVPSQEPVWSGSYPYPEDERRRAAEEAKDEADRKARIETMRKFARDVGVGVTTNLVTAAVLYLAAAEAGYIRRDKAALLAAASAVTAWVVILGLSLIPRRHSSFRRALILVVTLILLVVSLYGFADDFRTLSHIFK